jgi:S1-C subfamily serine protease
MRVMTIRSVCSGCRAAYQLPDNLAGKKVKCRHCGQVFLAAATPGPTPPEAAAEAGARPHAPAAPTRQPAPRPQPEERVAEQEVPERPPAATPRRRSVPPPEEDDASDVPAEVMDREERPRRARRRAPVEEEDGDEERPRRKKGGVSLLTVFAGTLALLVIVAAVGLGAYFMFEYKPASQGNPQQPPNVPPFAFRPPDESPLMERQANLDAYFRTPEEPPLHGLEFTEPPPASEPGPGNGKAPRPSRNTTGQLTPEVLQRIKDATVYLRVKLHEGEAEGSGFFCGGPGLVLTNAHVVGMLTPGAPEPASIRVVRNKGEKEESSFPAKLVALDRDADLALLSVQKEGMPEPLVVKSAQDLQETQPVYVAGFPLGEVPGKSITINKYELSSLKKEKGVLDKLQVHGDMLPGNSGGPLLDADGDVVGVCVAILRNTRINFAIPGDKVLRLLNGRLAELNLGSPTQAEGGLQVPVTMRLADPLGRVSQAALDFWVGKPGPARPGSWTAPEPQPGDGTRQTLALVVKEQVGHAELPLPPLPPGQAYWVQPNLVNRNGTRVWLSAQVYQPTPPVERKPARLAFQPAAETPLLLERWSALQFTDPFGHDHHALVTTETRLTDAARGRQGNDRTLSRQFTGYKEGLSVDGETRVTKRLQNIGPNLQFVASNPVVDAQGTTKSDEIDLKIKNAPPQAKFDLMEFREQMRKVLAGLEVPLPGEEVQPGQTWKARRSLPIDATWKQLQLLPPEVWGTAEPELDVTYTYTGLRTVNGAEQAVIHLEGQAASQGPTGGTGGRLSGTAVVDLATGQVVEEEVTTQATLELAVAGSTVVKVHGTILTRLRKE